MSDIRFFSINIASVLGYILFSSLLIVVLAWQDIVERIAGYDTVELINRTLIDNFEALLRLTENFKITNYLATLFFWAVVALVVYIFIWLFLNIVIAIYNKWVIRTQYLNKGQIHFSTMLEHAVRKVLIITIPLINFMLLWTVLPWVIARFKSALVEIDITILFQIFAGVLALSFITYASVVWLRVVLGRPDLLNS